MTGQLSIVALNELALAGHAGRPSGGWHRLRARWRTRGAEGGASIWRELYRELRRHAGDERLPSDLRTWLRQRSLRAFERSQRHEEAFRFPRMAFRAPSALAMPSDATERGRAAAERLGIPSGRPFVALDIRGHDDALGDSVEMLASRRIGVVRLDRESQDDFFLLRSCRFLICDNPEAQRAAYLTDTPTLAVNAIDPFAWYPVRPDGIYLLKTAVDLDTGSALTLSERLSERYYRNLRNLGFRANRSGDIRDAVAEMLDGLSGESPETGGQTRYRAAVVAAGAALAGVVPFVAQWGPVNGFIGDGRLARIQADRL